MKRIPLAWVVSWAIFFVSLYPPFLHAEEPLPAVSKGVKGDEVTLDFNNVDLPVLVKLISELTGKNFVIDEKVRGKVSLVSPSKIPIDRVFEVFLSVLELKGLTVVQRGDIYQIRPFAEVPPERSVHVYTLKNIKAEEIAKVIRGLAAKPAARNRRAKRHSKELSGQIQILSDKRTNSLIITATDSDFKILKGVIEKLDLKSRQVYVEAVILEVTADKFQEFGSDISAGLVTGTGAVPIAGEFNSFDLVTAAGLVNDSLVGSLGNINIRTILRALQSSSDINILSTPQILTSDKQKAEIVVAQNVPFPGAQSQTVGGNVQTTIERKDVGIILRLTPNILDDHRVELDVYQEISSVVESVVTSGGNDLGPTTKKRSASTTIIVKSGQTVVIGGLIRDNLITIDRKIPLLGDIPLIGWLFRFKSKRVEKTNLMIFLTPHIVLDEKKLEEIRLEKTESAASSIGEIFKTQQNAERLFGERVNLPQ